MKKNPLAPDPTTPNTLWTPNTWKYQPDPWNPGKNRRHDYDGRPGAKPVPIDFVGREYSELEMPVDPKSGGIYVQRDALIESIMDLDRSREEMVKRLIIEEDRIDILMKMAGYRAPDHQMMLNQFLMTRQFGIVLAPRGSGKSTCCDFAYAAMRAIQNRNIRILIASRTIEQAKAFLFEIKSILTNEGVQSIFGDLKGSKWDETQADIAGRTKYTKEHTFTIAGADGAVVSKHFDLIIGDDIVEDKNSRTEGQREQLKKFFYRSMLPTLRPDGEMRILGTRYHPEDLYGHLINSDPMFDGNHFILPAVFDRDTGKTVDLEQDDNGKFYAPMNATCYDPDGYPMTKIIERRASMPLADFECQYQNRTTFLEGEFFKSNWFRYYEEDPHALVEKHNLAVWIGVDLASSQHDKADEFALVVIGVTRNISEIYVLDYLAGRFTFNQQKAILVDYFDIWNPVRTFVEGNAYQQMLTTTTIEEFPDVRLLSIWTTKDKITRARMMQIYYERRQVFHRKGRSAKLEGELTGFPDLKLKDLVDAEFFAINGAINGSGRRRRPKDKEPGLF